MQERERILELVKKGILSTEEALVLLENIATEKDEKLVKKEATNLIKSGGKLDNKINESDKQEHSRFEDLFESDLDVDEQDVVETLRANEERDKEQLEKILAELAEEANQTSVELDELNADIQELLKDIREQEEAIMVLNTMEDLETLTPEKSAERDQLEKDLSYLIETLEQLEAEKEIRSEALKNIKREQKVNMKEEWKSKFDIPEDWKEQANDTMNQVSDKMGEASSQFGEFLKKTIETVTKSVNDNVDWKDINIKVPGVASQSFTHEFVYPENQATIIDVKVANGKIKFKTWDNEDVKVEADIKFYGKINSDSLFEAFLERSDIDVTDEKISFQIPNKRLKVDLTFYLPNRMYDHISIKMLNGDILLEHLDVGDVFLKSTNGEITVTDITASMLEVEGVNGDIEVRDSHIIDFLAETVNGDVSSKANIQTIKVGLINGDIRLTSSHKEIQKIQSSVVNGAIKVALPESKGIEGYCKTNFGSIKNRLTNSDIIREKKDRTSQSLEFSREAEDELVKLNLTTTTGSIYLKDTEN
ncbi:MAG: daptomycin-sensing surface protein LiaX [Vagococcus sp.]